MTRTTTRVEDVFQRLRADILNGRHEPGSRLRVEALKDHYGASSGVLREALPRLVGQGLATFAPQQGFRVMEVSPAALRDLTDARVVIETHVVREAIEHGTIAWESDLLAAHHNLARTAFADENGAINESWLSAHTRFHETLLAGCPNYHLREVASQFRDSAEVYRCWARTPTEHSPRDVPAEHKLICERAIARDIEGTVEALREHIELTTALMLEES
ncbi:GntR family transcriptional regulator [Streptomyces lydicus]|uniref:GntR family transcriptional regulator n=1 Tax=Streptomyces lydicus TaxID=47763 RepID=UPI002E2F6A65|nr:FCD domain-containing protein [Streptomyces lydicus]